MTTEQEERDIYKKIQAKHGKKGGEATFKKLGSKGMTKVAEARWGRKSGIV